MYTYSLGMYEKALPDEMPLSDKLHIAKESGFDHLEFCVDMNPERAARLDWSPTERRQAREEAEKIGVPFTTFSLSLLRKTPLGLCDDAQNCEALRVLDMGCRLACDLGSRVMLVNGYDVYNEPSTDATRTRFFKNLPLAAAICARYGLVCGIENAEMPFCQTIKDAVEICQRAPSPFLRVYADIGNSTNAFDGDAEQTVQDLFKGEGYIASMHLKDSIPGEYRFRAYGKGHVDFARCIAAAKKMNIRLFTAEIFRDPDRDAEKNVRSIASFLRSFF